MATATCSWAATALPKSGLWGSRVSIGASPPLNAGISSRPGLVIEARKRIEGKVVCSTDDKTVSVEVTRIVVDPKSKKRLRRSKKYHAHDPDNSCKLGDFVTLAMSRPYSKTKRFIVTDIKGRTMGGAAAVGTAAGLPPMQSAVEGGQQEQEATLQAAVAS